MRTDKQSPLVALVLPPMKFFNTVFPMGLGYLAAVLKLNNYKVKVLDFSKKKYSPLDAAKEVVKVNPQFVGFTSHTFTYNVVKEMIREIKKSNPRIKIIVGGPHASALPRESLEDLKADIVVIGEGEEVCLEIIRRLDEKSDNFKDILGIAYWDKGAAVLNAGCNIIEDLDKLPFPEWEGAALRKYSQTGGDMLFRDTPFAPVLTSRGCPYKCIFCSEYVVHGRNFRKRSPQLVGDEMEFLVKNYGIKEFGFFDVSFAEEKQHAMEVCNEIIKRNLNISWGTVCDLRLDSIDEDLLRIFKRSGCYKLGFGIETSSVDMTRKIRKPITQTEVIDKIKLVNKYGIQTIGQFMLGLPGETKKTIMDTIRFSRGSDLDFVSFARLVPFPGSDIFNRQYANAKPGKWDDYYLLSNRQFGTSGISGKQLKWFLLIAYVFPYFKLKRIKNILIFLKNLRKPKFSMLMSHIAFMLKSIYSW